MATPGRDERGSYIITEDLSKLVPRWLRERNLEPKDGRLSDEYFRLLFRKLSTSLEKHCFRDTEVRVEPKDHREVDGQLRKDWQVHEFWICLDEVYPVLAPDAPDRAYISITRYVDTDWNSFGFRGPRPTRRYDNGPLVEELPLEEQARRCAAQASDFCWRREDAVVALVDDGWYEGKTLLKVLNLLEKYECKAKYIRVGIRREIEEDPVFREIRARGIQIKPSTSFTDLYDWVCERDFFPGVPLGGKVVSTRLPDGSGRALLVDPEGRRIPVRAQYLQDWGHITEWAGILRGLNSFTLEALRLSLDLWRNVEAVAGRTITVGELPAVPHRLLSDSPSDEELLRKPWLAMLEGYCRAWERRLRQEAKWT